RPRSPPPPSSRWGSPWRPMRRFSSSGGGGAPRLRSMPISSRKLFASTDWSRCAFRPTCENDAVAAARAVEEVDPRVERSRRVILEATLGELGEVGYGTLTIEAVAARAGVGKSTIYRHWPGKLEL